MTYQWQKTANQLVIRLFAAYYIFAAPVITAWLFSAWLDPYDPNVQALFLPETGGFLICALAGGDLGRIAYEIPKAPGHHRQDLDMAALRRT